MWYELVDPTSARVKYWSADNPPINEIGKDYSIFEGNLYNKNGQKLLTDNVSSYKPTKIDNADYYTILSSGGEELALLNASKGEIWKKESNSIWSNGNQKMMLKNNQFFQVDILDNQLGIFTLKHPEFDRYSLYVDNLEVLPFKSTNTKLLTHYKGNHILYEIALECKSGLYSTDIDDLIAALKRKNKDFIISNKSGLGTSIFAKDGTEIVPLIKSFTEMAF